MKKATFFAAATAILGLTSINANAQVQGQVQGQVKAQTEAIEQTVQDVNHQVVKLEETPEAVQNALKNDVYKDWTVGEISKVAPKEGDVNAEVVYEVKMTNAAGQTGVVRMNAEGGAATTSGEKE
ncbi:hypothetical protein [Pontibacter oryzae]|uniref:PepSY domain-containing protein n=1 Tax=Pontibacter oryzae TaxID=2304593 RepID=A0A399RY54_9BACT|nr:hypothetical protein [Pontibacter oryzae]RIJ36696.1 hypothetical protein D1627_12710 [Pontibacter oryzae]